MSDAPLEQRPTARPADYAVLGFVCLTAALAGATEVLLVPLYAGGSILPITVLFGAATTYGLPKLGAWMVGAARGAVLPLLSWLVVVLALGFLARPEGDVIVQGGNNEQWVMFALVIAGAVIGFSTVLQTSVSAPPVRRGPTP